MHQADGDSGEGGILVENPGGASPVLLVCEHGGNRVPARYGDLGVGPDVLSSHVAWDPGALAVARGLSAMLDAPLVAQTVSRLVYDCNRPPDAPGAMPAVSEVHAIPGNANLDAEARAERVRTVYRPFEACLESHVERHVARHAAGHASPAVLTIHSFTPTFHGRPRSVEIGILHGDDRRLADALLAMAGAGSLYDVRR
ncbi:MAG: N-formylglutamate amidohydrolase, partial [Pseudomonadota bacterium]